MAPWAGPCLLAAVGVLRLWAARNPCLDDDEAWFAVSALMLDSPADLYRLAWDNKPPGTVAFYWAVAQVWRQPSSLIVATRAVMALALGGAAWVWAGWLARLRPAAGSCAGHTAWLLLALSAAGPKQLATTNESLMLVVLTGTAVAVLQMIRSPDTDPAKALASTGTRTSPAAVSGSRGWAAYAWALAAGLGVGCACLLKTTGLAFVLLPLSAAAAAAGPALVALAAAAATVAAAAAACGASAFLDASLTYPMQVLAPLRAERFSILAGPVLAAGIWTAVLAPLWWPQKGRRKWAPGAARWLTAARGPWQPLDRLMLAWAAAALAAIAAGRGFFLHYYLLAAPPAAWGLARLNLTPLHRPGRLAALFVVAATGHLLAGVDGAGVLWGSDTQTWAEVARRIDTLSPADSRVLMWGGHATPLALAGRHGPVGLVTHRFAAPPYADAAMVAAAAERLAQAPPALLVDASGRSDNMFSTPWEAAPDSLRAALSGYRAWGDPNLPWVRFWLPPGATAPGGFCPDPPPATLPPLARAAQSALRGHHLATLWRQRVSLEKGIVAQVRAQTCPPPAPLSPPFSPPQPAISLGWWGALATVAIQSSI